MKTETLQDLYMKELRDLYGAEKLLVKTLPKFMSQAELPELRQALSHQLEEARGQLTRLERVFQIHGEKAETKKPRVMEAILREAEEDIGDAAEPSLRDAAIVAAGQQIKHNEIAGYGTVQAYAIHLGHGEASRLLQQTLDEERSADQKLTEIALNHLRVPTRVA